MSTCKLQFADVTNILSNSRNCCSRERKARKDCIQYIIDFHNTSLVWEHIQTGTKTGGPKEI